jgi:hypothetical protein
MRALRPVQYGSRSSRFMILPMVLRGSESRNSIATSRCVLLSWLFAHYFTCSSLTVAPSRRTQSAIGDSPH